MHWGPVHTSDTNLDILWFRNFFFAHSASVRTYPVSQAYESATFSRNPLSRVVEIFEYAMNPESCGR